MTRKILVVGIGAGNPDHMTVQAIDALNRASVLFMPDKGSERAGLAQLRRDICDRFITSRDYRLVAFDTPPVRGTVRAGGQDVAAWREKVARIHERLLAEELGEDDCGAFLVWGDPTLYDGTLRILEQIRAAGAVAFDYEIVPGITSVQALAARHKVPLNRTGDTVAITTGRKVAGCLNGTAGSVVVMLDGGEALKAVPGDYDIYWGAYVGTPDEILVAGKVKDVAGSIERLKKAARKEHGWVMDTYLLRRPEGS